MNSEVFSYNFAYREQFKSFYEYSAMGSKRMGLGKPLRKITLGINVY